MYRISTQYTYIYLHFKCTFFVSLGCFRKQLLSKLQCGVGREIQGVRAENEKEVGAHQKINTIICNFLLKIITFHQLDHSYVTFLDLRKALFDKSDILQNEVIRLISHFGTDLCLVLLPYNFVENIQIISRQMLLVCETSFRSMSLLKSWDYLNT